jgi:hypothetical protein
VIDRPEPWEPGSGSPSAGKLHAPATLRNRDAILAILGAELPASGLVLEVASGSGEHAAHFAAALPHLEWQPSDPDPAALASIEAYRIEAALGNLRRPVRLDVTADWPVTHADAILCINMAHISPWAATIGLMKMAGTILARGGLLYLYGPFFRDETQAAASNLAFDASLKARDSEWGIRRVEDVIAVAAKERLVLQRLVEMPANNLSLIFRARD